MVGLAKEVITRQHVLWDSTVARGLRTSAVMRDEVNKVVCPAFADSISEGDVKGEKDVGDFVAEDDVLCEIVPVPSPAIRVITELLVEVGNTVSPGMKLFSLAQCDLAIFFKHLPEGLLRSSACFLSGVLTENK